MPRETKILAFPAGVGSVRPAAKFTAPAQALALAAALFLCLVLLHLPLLNLPYFWDEAGYYIPAARDLLLSGSLIPHSTQTNAHPPLVMIWLALWWKFLGFRPLITRLAMLAISTFTLAGVFRLARQVSNQQVAIASTAGTALYPVFFAQSSLAHLDIAAAGFTLWALSSYLHDQRWQACLFFSLAALGKETAIIAPIALAVWELARPWLQNRGSRPLLGERKELQIPRWLRQLVMTIKNGPDAARLKARPFKAEDSRASSHPVDLCLLPPSLIRILWLLLPLLPLALWFAYHYHKIGFVFGNPGFVSYNLTGTLHPVRFLAALLERLWQLLGYLNMFLLTIATALAMRRPAILDVEQAAARASGNGDRHIERPRIAIATQLVFAVILIAYLLVLSLIGGAVLARYLLPVYPLVIIICVSTIWRRISWWQAFLGVVSLGFLIGLVTSPPYHFAPEDNLDYAQYVRLHQNAGSYLQLHYRKGPILTAWPASDELTHPYLGYVSNPIPVVHIENFSYAELLLARQAAQDYEAALVFSTKYEPPYGFLLRLPYWQKLQQRYFDYHRDLPPAAAAQILGGHIVWTEASSGQWAAIIEMDRALNAGRAPHPRSYLTNP